MSNLGKAYTPSDFIPARPNVNLSSIGIVTLNALAKKVAYIGYVDWSDGGTHPAAVIGVRCGATTAFGGGTVMRVSFQNVDVSGSNAKPDGNVDENVTTSSAPTANVWNNFTLGSARSLAHGDLIAVVFDYTNFGSGSVALAGLGQGGDINKPSTSFFSYSSDSGVTWASSGSTAPLPTIPTLLPIIGLKSNDATPIYGTLYGSLPISATGLVTVNTGTNPKEILAEITSRKTGVATGLWGICDPANNADYSLVLYDSSDNILKSITIDTCVRVDIGERLDMRGIAGENITDGSLYRIGVKPVDGTSVSVRYIEVNGVGWWDLISYGQDIAYSSRASDNSINAATATRRPLIGMILSTVDSGGGNIESNTFGLVR